MEEGTNNVLHQYGRTASQCYICPMTLSSQEIGEQRDMECFPIFVAIPPFTDDTLHIETKPYSSLVHEQSRCLRLMNQERVNPDVFLRCWTNQCGNNQSRWQWVESGWKPLPKTSDVAKVCFQCSFCSEISFSQESSKFSKYSEWIVFQNSHLPICGLLNQKNSNWFNPNQMVGCYQCQILPRSDRQNQILAFQVCVR